MGIITGTINSKEIVITSEMLCASIEGRAAKVAAKVPANKTPQIELLYRDIRLQMNELNELRQYKAAVEEINTLADNWYKYSSKAALINAIDEILNKIKK